MTLAPLFLAALVSQALVQGSVHLLGAGDVVRVTVRTQDEEMTVNPEGAVFIRGLGAVPVVGLAPDSAARDLAARIQEAGYPVADSDVTVFLVRIAPPPEPPRPPPEPPEPAVFVTGAVRKPGEYPASTAGEALRAAGGVTDRADTATLTIAGRASIRLDAAALIERRTDDVPIETAATIVVEARPEPPKPPDPRDLTPDEGVTVLGEVGKPGVYAPGRLTAVLAAAGGTTREASRRLEVRSAEGGTRRLDVRRVLRGDATDESIQPGTVINVPRAVNPFRIIGDVLGITRGVQGVAR